MKSYLSLLTILSCFIFVHCSHYEDDIDLSNHSTAILEDKLVETAVTYVEQQANKIFGKNNYPTPLAFNYQYYWSKTDENTYLTLYITPILEREPISLNQMAQEGYTNIVFQLDASGTYFSQVHLIKAFPTIEYLKQRTVSQELPTYDIRHLIDIETFQGSLHFYKDIDRKSSDRKTFSNDDDEESTMMDEIIIIIGPDGPVDGGGGGGHPPRPTWGTNGNSGSAPPYGSGGSSGSGTNNTAQQTPREKKIATAKNPSKILKATHIRDEMTLAWDKGITLGGVEVAFWIFYDPDNDIYYKGEFMIGEININPLIRADHIKLIPPNPYLNNVPPNSVAVGIFHTHPPINPNSPSDYQREVGPSETDIDHASRNNITGFVMDFVGITVPRTEKKVITSGDKSPTKIYTY